MTELDPESVQNVFFGEHHVDFCLIGAGAAWLQGASGFTLNVHRAKAPPGR